MNITTKFDLTSEAFVLSYARDSGELVGGIVDEVVVVVGKDGTSIPSIRYRMTQTMAFVPPGGVWLEYELGTREEATALANAYNRALSAHYSSRISEA
jgi:hypothetical protein